MRPIGWRMVIACRSIRRLNETLVDCDSERARKKPQHIAGPTFRNVSTCFRPALIYCAGLLGAGFAGVGLVGAGLVGAGVPAGGAIVLAGGRVSFAAVLVPFCPG